METGEIPVRMVLDKKQLCIRAENSYLNFSRKLSIEYV